MYQANQSWMVMSLSPTKRYSNKSSFLDMRRDAPAQNVRSATTTSTRRALLGSNCIRKQRHRSVSETTCIQMFELEVWCLISKISSPNVEELFCRFVADWHCAMKKPGCTCTISAQTITSQTWGGTGYSITPLARYCIRPISAITWLQ